jgi:hypothetical protein
MLAARVAERLGRNPFSEHATQSIEGSAALSGDRLRAELFVRDAGGVARGTRELSAAGADCVELADAVVLAVVLTIDPNAALSGTPAPPPLAPPPPLSVESSSGPEPAPLGACPASPCPPRERCPNAACPPPPRFAHASLVARGVLAAGVLPNIAPGAAVFGELGSARARVTLGMLYLPESATDDGVAGFGLTAGAIGGALAWPVARGVELSALAELELGAVHAVVYELEPVRPGDRPWVALGAGPRLLIAVFPPLRLELGASLVVPFIRPSFEARGVSEPVFQSSPLAGLGFIGVGLGLP